MRCALIWGALSPGINATVAVIATRYSRIYLPEEVFTAAFAQNASTDELALAAVQQPLSPACITVPVGRPLWKDRPAWFLMAEEDRMIVHDTQRFMAEWMHARDCRLHGSGAMLFELCIILRQSMVIIAAPGAAEKLRHLSLQSANLK
jgi:hypothetical protein